MMKLLGAIAGLALMAGTAQAQGTSEQGGSAGMEGSGTGSSGSMSGSSTGTMGSTEAAGQQQMEGKVLKSSSGSLIIEHLGAAIPFEVTKSTTFQGVKSAKEIKEGEQVRASFEMKKNKNELRSIEVLGTGGSGATEKSKSSKDSSKSKTESGTGGSSY